MAKTTAERQQRIAKILPILKRTYPTAKISLNYKTPFQLLIATILSAQCTDERVNMVTPALFARYKTPADLAAAPLEQLERQIQTTGFYHNKAKALHGMAEALVKEHGGKVPQTMEELVNLPGVGRKTANVVLGNAFGKSVGVVVDTHVGRVTQRLGLTKQKDPVKVEQDLMQIVPRDEWTHFAHLLIYHGRALCTARNPKCNECPLLPYCPTGQKGAKPAPASRGG